MAFNATMARSSHKICSLVGGIILLAGLYSVTDHEVRAGFQNPSDREPASSKLLVIQGRITGIQGTLATVKIPDGYPGDKGGRAQFVTAGPILRIDVSHARVLFPDGKQIDNQPLAIGDRVLMVLTGPAPGQAEPANAQPTYSASIVERVVEGDKIITH